MALALKFGDILRHRSSGKARKLRYLISAAGVPNYGDEFITRAWLRWLATAEPESEVWLDCISPAHSAHLFADIHPNLHFTSTAWNLVWTADERADTLDEAQGLIGSWMVGLGSPREDLGIIKMRSADSVHLLGGGYINEIWPHHVLLADIVGLVKQFRDVPVFCTGLGIAPCGDEWLAHLKDAIRPFDHIGIRDEASAEALGVPCGVDDAFLGVSGAGKLWRNERKDARVFICMQQDIIGKHPDAVGAVVQALADSGVSEDERLILVEAIPPDDGWALDALAERWSGEVVLMPFLDLWQQGFPTAKDAIWITSRFHMHLIGAASGASGLFLDFEEPFYSIKHGSLIKLGTGWTRLRPDDTGGAPLKASFNNSFASLAKDKAARKRGEAKLLYGMS